MKSKRFFSSMPLNIIESTPHLTRSSFSKSANFKKLLKLFPSLPKDSSQNLVTFSELRENLKQHTLPDLISQANIYLNSSNITMCREAIEVIMDFIHTNNIQYSKDKNTLKILASAYYIHGMVKAAGDGQDRLEAEKLFASAINFAKNCEDQEIEASANNELRSLELHRFKLREGESLVFEEEPETSSITKNHT